MVKMKPEDWLKKALNSLKKAEKNKQEVNLAEFTKLMQKYCESSNKKEFAKDFGKYAIFYEKLSETKKKDDEKITFTIKKRNHKRLSQMKIDEDLKDFDAVIDFLFEKQKK